MADKIYSLGNVPVRFVDMGDGTFAQGVLSAACAVSILPNAAGNKVPFTAAETGTWLEFPASVCMFQTVQSGAGSCVVEVHGSAVNTVTPGSGTLLGTLTTSADGDTATLAKEYAAYKYKLAKPTTLTATDVTVLVGA